MSSSWMWTGRTLLGQLLILYPSPLHWIWEEPQGMWVSEAWGLPFQRPRWWLRLCELDLVYLSPHNVCKCFLQPLVSHCLASSKVFPLLPSHYFLICKHLMVISWKKTKQSNNTQTLCSGIQGLLWLPRLVCSLSSLVFHSLWLHFHSVRTTLLPLLSSLLHSVSVQCPTHRCTSPLEILLHVTWFVDSVCRHPTLHSFST